MNDPLKHQGHERGEIESVRGGGSGAKKRLSATRDLFSSSSFSYVCVSSTLPSFLPPSPPISISSRGRRGGGALLYYLLPSGGIGSSLRFQWGKMLNFFCRPARLISTLSEVYIIKLFWEIMGEFCFGFREKNVPASFFLSPSRSSSAVL